MNCKRGNKDCDQIGCDCNGTRFSFPVSTEPLKDPFGIEAIAKLEFREQILVNALKAIVHHQDMMGGGLSELSTTKFIAERALLAWMQEKL